ncbi:MAG TPA: sensor histidine kinase KdpD [Candidatus Methylacidiphilales bacterium]|nr:sensor histidine kinase KdpD [Candidatus Methylacidiphilales bacterium]
MENTLPVSDRPTPEDFLHLIQKQSRGKLKVYLGSSAGVGKTYAMLQEGNRLKQRGVDVVIGYVEPHERPETTAQIGALEVVPSRVAVYHGMEIREMDLEAVLKRKPTVVLVDEFAHTNAPGSKNPKRYEDVLELLDGGISVITTLNIQHLESLYNVVEAATGTRVKERIPDSVVTDADQIVNIDLPAEDLIERLKAGKIYALDRVENAMSNFFTESNLTRLREITFSEVANFLDRRQREKEPGHDKPSSMAKVMVAISSKGPHPETLLRKTARLANQLNAEWYTVYVRTSREAPDQIAAETHRRLTDTLEIAQKMGGTVVILKSDNVTAALTSFARDYGVTQVVMGRPRRPRGLKRFFPSLLDELSRKLTGVDIIIS